MIDPRERARNLRRLAAKGLEGDYGFFDAIDYTHARHRRRGDVAPARAPRRGHRGADLPGPSPGHDPGALANALLGDPMVKRFHADPRVQATELLLQERVPRQRADRPSRGRSRRCASPRRRPRWPSAASARRTRASRTRSSCRTATTPRSSPTPAAARSFCRGRAVTRHRDGSDARPGEPVHLPARRAERRRLVGHLSADAPGAGRLRRSTFLPEKATLPPPRRRHRRRSSTSRSRPKTTSRCAG